MLPNTCQNCGTSLGNLLQKYNEMVKKNIDKEKIFESLGLFRYCCRINMLTYIDEHHIIQ